MSDNENKDTRILRTSSFRIPQSPVNNKTSIYRNRSTRISKNTPLKEPVVSISKMDINFDNNSMGSEQQNNKQISTRSKEIENLELHFQEQISLKCKVERYFYQNSDKSKFVSSKKTLADLGCHRLATEQAGKLLKKLPKPYSLKEIKERVKYIEEKLFPTMIMQLKNGYNVLMHGFGSKLPVLESFVNTYLQESTCLVIPAFQNNVSVAQALNYIIDSIGVSILSSSRSPSIIATAIRKFYDENPTHELFLAIHNIDGPGIGTALEALVILTQSPSIHLIATVDHINSDQLWLNNSLNWLWHDCTTGLPYTIETLSLNSRMMAESSSAGLDSLKAVTASLHNNAKQIFLLLAKYQMENQNPKYEGMSVEILLCQSRNAFFVLNELALRNLLTEFKDHKLIIFKYGLDRSEYIKITLDSNVIQEYIDNFSSF